MEEIKEAFKKNKETIYILILTVVTMILNFKNFISKGQSSVFSFIISILYVVLWFYIIQKTKKNFLFFEYSTSFWIITTLVSISYYFIYSIGYSGEYFAPVALIFISEIYSIGDFLFPYSIYKIYAIMIISIFFSLVSYLKFKEIESIKEKDELIKEP